MRYYTQKSIGKETVMTNKDTDITFQVSANLPAVYTAAHFISGIPMIKNIMLRNIPENLCTDLAIVIEGKCSSGTILDFRFEKKNLRFGSVTAPDSDTAIINLEKHKILPKADFMHKLSANTFARIQITVMLGNNVSSCISNIKIAPFGLVCPEMPPELLCTYVLPDCEFAAKAEKKLSAEAKKIAEKRTVQTPKPLLYAEALAAVMQSAKLTYSAVHREFYDGDCVIRDPDNLTESNLRSVSQTEAALLYCSCAERCGLRPGIVFLRKGAGAVKVLISIGLGDYYAGSTVSESIAELRERILDREMFVFDVLGLLGTEDTDFARNVTETTNLVLKSSSTLSFAVDIYTSRLSGVSSLRPFDGTVAKDIYGGYESISDAVKRIDKNAAAVSVYGYSPYTNTSLGLCLTDGIPSFTQEYCICPLDDDTVCSNPDSILSFSSFVPKNFSAPRRNITEQSVYDTKLGELCTKISRAMSKGNIFAYPSKYILSGEKLSPERIRDEVISDCLRLCESVKASAVHNGRVGIYAAAGIVKLTDEDRTYYAPCAYIPCELTFEPGQVKLIFGSGKTVFNRSLRSIIEDMTGAQYNVREEILLSEEQNEISSLSDDNIREIMLCLEIYKGICEDFPEKLSFINDTFLSAFDLSYTLMRECLERADGKKFEEYLESGKYVNAENISRFYGRFESTLPFETPSDSDNAVRIAENDSVVISGVHGTGKKKTVGNIIARAALSDESVLVASKYPESLSSLYDVMDSKGIAELCLNVTDAVSTKEKILSDIDKMSGEPEYPREIENTDAAIQEHGLAIYADDIYSEFGFGYSLYDCINEYCKLDIVCPDKPIDLSVQIRDLSRENSEKLFELAGRLTEKAQKIYGMCVKGISDISPYLKYIRNTSEITKTISSTLADTEEQLLIFAQKSAFARNCLGISDSNIQDVRTLISFGEFLELIIKSGIDFLPEELLAGSTYKSAKNIEKGCDIVDEICSVNSYLTDVSDRIASISCTELYIKWRDSENNPFVRNSISHEIKKYLPAKSKHGAAEIDELLEKLARREQLESELSHLASDIGSNLGKLWQGTNTDTERARSVASFALSADICIKKLFRNTSDNIMLQEGLAKLIRAISEDKDINADFILAVGAFRKLAPESGGLFEVLSRELCADLYELHFDNGILATHGMARTLHNFRDNPEPLFYIHELNSVKKEAVSAGLSEAASYIEDNGVSDNTGTLICKSLFLAFANYIISSKTHPEGDALFEKYGKYRETYEAEKKLACYNLISTHRRRFRDYISDDEGKSELYALRETLNSASSTVLDILDKHRKILGAMYSAILTESTCAYRLCNPCATLILLDCEKTDAAEGLPLCANFDKCIFVTSPIERIGSIMSSLPLGLPTVKLTRVLCEKNGNIASFAGKLYKDVLTLACPERSRDNIRFIKCSGGIYDKNTGGNRIEALKVCETALECCERYGFENVGIIAMTPAQTAEILNGLELMSNKYKNERIAEIPTRYIGNMGDFTKECIVLSVAFGKNIYSFTRSFGITDDISLLHTGSPICLCELLSCGKELNVVSSAEPEDILTDSLCRGADAISSLLTFAKYGAVSFDISSDEKESISGGIEAYLSLLESKKSPDAAIRCSEGIITSGENAVIYEKGYVRNVYDRILLPEYEAEQRGYNVSFCDICELIKNK